MDTGQKTESLAQLVADIDKGAVALPEFQRDFRWEPEKIYDLFDSFVRDIFIGSLIYGTPSFEVTVRELDMRPRSGQGSRQKLKIQSYTKSEIERLIKTRGFRLLLDGQQRATSIYRALKGIDPVYFVVTPDDELHEDVRAISPQKRGLEHVLSEFRGDPLPSRICINLKDVYQVLNGEAARETQKLQLFLGSSSLGLDPDKAATSEQFEVYLTQLKNLENLLRQEKLVAYYLLDTDEEKFALFFERSNSKGIQLNFIDILAAKLYVGFNLRKYCDEFVEANPSLRLNREVLVRAISFVVSGGKDTGRAYILSNLTHAHFNEHWNTFTLLYKRAYDYLQVNRLLIHPDWVPYENMLIPLIAFIRHIPHYDFAQLSSLQASILRTWYWLAVLSRRYSSAAQTAVLEDAQMLERVAQGNFKDVAAWLTRFQPHVQRNEDLFTVFKKYDALYKGILNIVNYDAGGLVSLQSGEPLSWESNLEDHHIFPKDYLKKRLEDLDIDSDTAVDCVVNRTLIPKLTNIKASNKAPSEYLAEIAKQNGKLADALHKHRIPADLTTGAYDDLYQTFLDDRATWILRAIEDRVIAPREKIIADLTEA